MFIPDYPRKWRTRGSTISCMCMYFQYITRIFCILGCVYFYIWFYIRISNEIYMIFYIQCTFQKKMRQQQKRGFWKSWYINQKCLLVNMLSSKTLDHHHYEKEKNSFQAKCCTCFNYCEILSIRCLIKKRIITRSLFLTRSMSLITKTVLYRIKEWIIIPSMYCKGYTVPKLHAIWE
jgi:hypothetical protein